MKKTVLICYMLIICLFLPGCAEKNKEMPAGGQINAINLETAIEALIVKSPKQADSIVYMNTLYGFEFTLPASWKGYAIVESEWEGLSTDGETPVAKGPEISIRHPLWTEENPRQDIPIMVFSTEQWNALQSGEFHIGAAPIGPDELGRNGKYIFALPARYNFAFLTGFEEVEHILRGKPLKTFEPIETPSQ
jgi:hypothetical protein